MYALGNIEKFLSDNAFWIGPEIQGRILARAQDAAAPDGVIYCGYNDRVFPDPAIERKFERDMGKDPAHADMALAVIRAANR